jgi:hypothetical protein
MPIITTAKAQSLAEILTAIQKRKQLTEERWNLAGKLDADLIRRAQDKWNSLTNDSDNYMQTVAMGPYPNEITDEDRQYVQSLQSITPDLIEWKGVGEWPAEGDIEKLGIEGQLELINQAWDELDRLDSEYWDEQSIENGVGTLKSISVPKLATNIPLNEARIALQRLAARVRRYSLVKNWPVLFNGTEDRGSYHYDEYWVQCGQGYSFFGGEGNWYGWHSPIDRAPGPGDSDGNYDTYIWHPYGAKLTDTSANGQVQLYTDFKYFITAMQGLGSAPGLPDDNYGDAGNLRWVSGSVSDSISALSLTVAPFDGDANGISYSLKDTGSNTYVPSFSNQSADLLPDDFNAFEDYAGIASNDVWGEGLDWDSLNMRTAFSADFGNEFSGKTQAPPEVLPALKIEPNLADGELVVRLANSPANECELVWKFPRTITTWSGDNDYGTGALAARNILTVRGCGNWHAVYSGRAGDREQVITWPTNPGDYTTGYKRWKDFIGYVTEYWQPVLVQLKTQTYAINITQNTGSRYKYEVDFYRQDQFGSEKINGRYDYPKDTPPLAKFTVENPESDPDSSPGSLKISTSDGATYLLSLAQTKTTEGDTTYADSHWVLSVMQGTKELLHKDVSVTQQRYSWTPDYTQNEAHWQISQSQPKKVVDQTSVDGIAMPQVTTTFWDFDWQLNSPISWHQGFGSSGSDEVTLFGHSSREYIDKIVEVGSEGTRTTTYSYAWDTKKKMDLDRSTVDYDHIDHLTGISQSGGINPYTANYDGAGQLTSYSDTWGSETVTYSGNTVTRTQKINGQPVRTLVTTYSGDMSTATTTAQ